ncbi:hypothetical protein [Vibrio scophthalmi]|uniref:TMhelix containing protein n=1 Tax=Vibrio scophthalmi TaxID=45658 RepID=A0A1E3WHB9_9VIBR|nr:hypothetical protein [Vibrio scophthalmi]ODS05205.1 hypothetical protein VSF3289_04346 [Vibrio scophthalmi]ODS10338.1 hypothetical protein VSF3289_00593 [Vibrio scophthalmi]ODS12592.1 hypothetical protein VSF3289_02917 [Vibrio scophthalmi]
MIGLVLEGARMVGGYFKERQQINAKKRERQDSLEEAKHIANVERIQRGETNASNLDEMSIKNRGWKDEFILLVVFVPLMLSFIPDYAVYVEQGFDALANIPEPYWYVVGAVVIDTLGMRAMLRYLLEFFSHKFRGK